MSSSKAEIIETVEPEFAKRKAYRLASPYKKIWDILDTVFDPELPGLTIWDLGILQDVKQLDDIWIIDVTPTYSGCPAVDAINQDIKTALSHAGYDKVEVNVVLSPAWTTQMMSPQGKQHLKSIKIAPPHAENSAENKVQCPNCDSTNTKVISQFGSTSCKALYQCESCYEAFDYFKHF